MEKKPHVDKSQIPVACDFGRLDRAHLGDPALGGLDLAHGAQLVRRVARDADVVDALQDNLDVANLKHLGAALLGVGAGRV